MPCPCCSSGGQLGAAEETWGMFMDGSDLTAVAKATNPNSPAAQPTGLVPQGHYPAPWTQAKLPSLILLLNCLWREREGQAQ